MGRIFALLFLSIILSGCFASTDEKVYKYMAKNQHVTAINWLNDLLREDPQNPLYNGLMAEVLLDRCFKENCFMKGNPPELERYMRHVREPIQLADNQFRDANQNIAKRLRASRPTAQYPQSYIALIPSLASPGLGRIVYADIFRYVSEHITKNEMEQARALLLAVEEQAVQGSAYQVIAGLSRAYLDGNAKDINAFIFAAQRWRDAPDGLVKIAGILPYAMFEEIIRLQPESGTAAFVLDFENMFQSLSIPMFNLSDINAAVATSFYTMRQAPLFMEKLYAHAAFDEDGIILSSLKIVPSEEDTSRAHMQTQANATPAPPAFENPLYEETADSDEAAAPQDMAIINSGTSAPLALSAQQKEFINLLTLRQAVALDSENQNYWKAYLQPSLVYANQYNDGSILLFNINPQQIPTGVVNAYNDDLLKIIKEKADNNENVVPFISKLVINTENEEKITAQAEEIVKDAMDKAVTSENYELIYAYGSFNPQMAQLSRQKIITSIIDALEKKWRENNFQGMTELSNFLNEQMEIDFNLDNLLIQNFERYLTEEKIETLLAADNIDHLLAPDINKPLDLEPKLGFLKNHFAQNPQIVNAQLKRLVLDAKGRYGIPYALYRLYPLFIESDFPKDERETYFYNALRNSILKDMNLRAEELAGKAHALNAQFPELTESFLLNEALNRITGAEEAKAFWASIDEDLKRTIRTIRPEFVQMIEAIDLYDRGDRTRAASMLSLITHENYMENVRPIIEDIRFFIRQNQGQYVLSDPESNASTVLIKLKPLETSTSADYADLTKVRVTFMNKIGTVMMPSENTLSEDYGHVYTFTVDIPLDIDSKKLMLTESIKTTPGLPQKFDDIFGNIHAIQMDDFDGLSLIMNEGTQTYYNKISTNTEAGFPPNGRYGITRQISHKDEGRDHVLPVGSILELQTYKNKSVQRVVNNQLIAVYPVKGRIFHPASDMPRPVTGFYTPQTHTTLLSYSYPLGDGGTLDAMVKCQILTNLVVCGGHNRHWTRSQFSQIVAGRKSAEQPDLPPLTDDVSSMQSQEMYDMSVPSARPSRSTPLPTPQEQEEDSFHDSTADEDVLQDEDAFLDDEPWEESRAPLSHDTPKNPLENVLPVAHTEAQAPQEESNPLRRLGNVFFAR